MQQTQVLTNWTKWQHRSYNPRGSGMEAHSAYSFYLGDLTNHSKMRKWRHQDKRTRKLLIFNFLEKPVPKQDCFKNSSSNICELKSGSYLYALELGCCIYLIFSFSFALLWVDLTRHNLGEAFWGSCGHMQALKRETNMCFFLKAKKETSTALR